MTTKAIEHVFTGTTTPYTSYDSTKTVLGRSIIQNTGTTATDQWAGPWPISLGQFTDTNYGTLVGLRPYVISVNDTLDWIILGDSTASTSGTVTYRMVSLVEYNKTTRKFKFIGNLYVYVPYAGTAGYHNMTSLSASRHLYTTGTASASGTAVTGTSTAWQTARYASGARIGFGSTNPDLITQWYDIATIGSNTSITLVSSAGTVPDGPFVIDELRICMTFTNGTTATNAGLYLVKGLNYDLFSAGGTTIGAATTVDNIRATYWLTNDTTTAITLPCGCPQEAPISNTEHYVYVMNAPTTTTLQIYKMNIRAALTVGDSPRVNGQSVSAYTFRTSASAAFTGAIATTNNGRIFTLAHGAGAGVPSIYFATASRIHRIPTNRIYDSSLNFIADGMLEQPPGTTSTHTAQGLFYNVDYSTIMDRLIITQTAGGRYYIAKYLTNDDPFDNWFGIPIGQVDRGTSLADMTPVPNNYTAGMTYTSGDVTYLVRAVHIYAMPLSVHWDYAATANQRLITPALNTPNAASLTRAYANADLMLASDAFGQQTDAYRLYARTTGITDDSGVWILLDSTGDLSSLTASTQIQLMVEFKIGWTCIPARIHSLMVIYETISSDEHFAISPLSNAANSQFVWKFIKAFGTTVPALNIKLYDYESNAILVNDYTDSLVGTFEKSTDGISWGSWNNTDRTNDTTFYRYTPVSLPTVQVKAILKLK